MTMGLKEFIPGFLWVLILTAVPAVANHTYRLPKHGIKVQAILRNHPLGALYNASTAKFYETLPISSKIPDDCLEVLPINHTFYDASLVSSTREKLSTVTLDAEAQLGLLSGMIQVDGKIAADWSKVSRGKEFQSVVLAQATTFEVKLNIHCPKFRTVLVPYIINSTDANYIVTSRILGVQYTIKLKLKSSEVSENIDLKGSLGAKMEKLAFQFKGALEGSFESSMQEEFQDISFSLDGNVDLPSKLLTSFDVALEYFQELNQNISHYRKENNGSTLFYIATPLDDVFQLLNINRTSEFMTPVDFKSAQEALSLFDSAEHMYNEGMHIDSQLKLHRQCFPARSSHDLTVDLIEFTITYGEYRRNISTAMYREHRGTLYAVMDAVSMFMNHENSPKNFEEKLEREYRSFLEMLNTVQRLDGIHAPCLPTNIKPKDVVLLFHDRLLVLLQYRSVNIDHNMVKWTNSVNDLVEICREVDSKEVAYNVTCHSIDCQFATHLCTTDQEPIIRVAYRGLFLELKNITALDLVLTYARRTPDPETFISVLLRSWPCVKSPLVG